MRSTLAIFLLIIVNCVPALGQKIHITDTTNTWYIEGREVNGDFLWAFFNYVGTFRFAYDYVIIQHYANVSRPYFPSSTCLREDTAAGLVYTYNNVTGKETLIYNYNLHPGDTIHFLSAVPLFAGDTTDIVDSVISVDSILIFGVYHKVFSLVSIDTVHSNWPGWNRHLTYIEGIGSVFDPVATHYAARTLGDTLFLKCFKRNLIAPTITINFIYEQSSTTLNFTNYCPPVVVEEGNKLESIFSAIVVPDPIDEHAQLIMSNTVAAGNIYLYNIFGQVIASIPVSNQKVVYIGGFVQTGGVFFYRVVDNSNSVIACGRFVKE